ncbi:hypothetical protein M1145_03550 [Patescibacteria group bacterium]|nr:hypothetical protein [Patescibacteria group bacterium]
MKEAIEIEQEQIEEKELTETQKVAKDIGIENFKRSEEYRLGITNEELDPYTLKRFQEIDRILSESAVALFEKSGPNDPLYGREAAIARAYSIKNPEQREITYLKILAIVLEEREEYT